MRAHHARTVGAGRAQSALALAAVLFMTGCNVEVPFSPFGEDFALSGSWTTNGVAPDRLQCGSIATVRVAFWHRGNIFIYGSGRDSNLTFRCEQGSFTTPVIYAYDDYRTQWQGLDVDGVTVAEGERVPLDVAAPATTAMLATFDFTTEPLPGGALSITLTWDGAADCGAVATIAYELVGSNANVESATIDAPCTTTVSWPDMPFDTYALTVEGENADGVAMWTATCEGIEHSAAGTMATCAVTRP